jgi:hypothetical protein
MAEKSEGWLKSMLKGLDQIRYENHLGESFGTGGYKLFMPTSELRNYEWGYDSNSTGNKVKDLKRKVVEKSLTFVIYSQDLDEVYNLRNNFYEIVSKDNLAEEMGKIYLDEYYIEGYIIKSKKSDYYKDRRFLKLEVSFITDGVWKKEKVLNVFGKEIESPREQEEPTITGKAGSEPVALESGVYRPEFKFDYFKKSTYKIYCPQYDYAYEYVMTSGKRDIINDNYVSSDFILTIYGFVNNPSIVIGGHQYQINTIVLEGERLVIDSKNKTVQKIGILGDVTNVFNSRNKDSSIFEKIPSGTQSVVYAGTYDIELKVIEERSEPKWI